MNILRKFNSFKFNLAFIFLILSMFVGCQQSTLNNGSVNSVPTMQNTIDSIQVDKNGTYTSKEEVAAYIHKYKKLPSNYISKPEAYELGWEPSEGNLHDVAPGKSIGGNLTTKIHNKVPKKDGQIFYECDINYSGGYRGQERIIYSNNGIIYYSPDHHETFELLYE